MESKRRGGRHAGATPPFRFQGAPRLIDALAGKAQGPHSWIYRMLVILGWSEAQRRAERDVLAHPGWNEEGVEQGDDETARQECPCALRAPWSTLGQGSSLLEELWAPPKASTHACNLSMGPLPLEPRFERGPHVSKTHDAARPMGVEVDPHTHNGTNPMVQPEVTTPLPKRSSGPPARPHLPAAASHGWKARTPRNSPYWLHRCSSKSAVGEPCLHGQT